MINKMIRYFLENRVIAVFPPALVVVWGISTAPPNWHGGIVPRNPIPMDIVPGIGGNQQIVAVGRMERSSKDIQDQTTYPSITSLLSILRVKIIRNSSILRMSFIYTTFEDDTEFCWSRLRILEKLNSLSSGMLSRDVQPTLGPDTMALGRIYWYTPEGHDPKMGRLTGGWNAEELRTIQDFCMKHPLPAAEGVSEVVSAGGFVREC